MEASGSSGRSDSLRDGDRLGEEGRFLSALGWPFQRPGHQHDSPKAKSLKFDSYVTTLRVSGGVCVFVLRRCSSHWSAAVRAPRSCGSASWSWRVIEIAVRQVSELATRFSHSILPLIPISCVCCRGAASAGAGEEAPGRCSR